MLSNTAITARKLSALGYVSPLSHFCTLRRWSPIRAASSACVSFTRLRKVNKCCPSV